MNSVRICACGCGVSLDGRRAGTLYVDGRCRVRAHRDPPSRWPTRSVGRTRCNGYSGSLGAVRAAGSGGVNVQIVGTPDADSDAAVARLLARFCERQDPGTVWGSGEGLETGNALEAAPGEVDLGAGGVDDEGTVAA